MMSQQARLPTYRTAARVLEGEKGSGLSLVGWTIARTFMIAPPMLIVGTPAKQAWLGAAFASALISTFTLLRLFNARETGLEGTAYARRRRLSARRASR